MPPPSSPAVLPEMVELKISIGRPRPSASIPPPLPAVAWLPEIVESMITMLEPPPWAVTAAEPPASRS